MIKSHFYQYNYIEIIIFFVLLQNLVDIIVEVGNNKNNNSQREKWLLEAPEQVPRESTQLVSDQSKLVPAHCLTEYYGSGKRSVRFYRSKMGLLDLHL